MRSVVFFALMHAVASSLDASGSSIGGNVSKNTLHGFDIWSSEENQHERSQKLHIDDPRGKSDNR